MDFDLDPFLRVLPLGRAVGIPAEVYRREWQIVGRSSRGNRVHRDGDCGCVCRVRCAVVDHQREDVVSRRAHGWRCEGWAGHCRIGERDPGSRRNRPGISQRVVVRIVRCTAIQRHSRTFSNRL